MALNNLKNISFQRNEVKIALSSGFNDMLSIFENSQGKEAKLLSEEIQALGIADELKSAICLALEGDNRDLNAWLFDQKELDAELSWIAPVLSPHPKYVWMVGRKNSQSDDVQSRLFEARPNFTADPLLKQRVFTPPLLFVDPYAVSKTRAGAPGMEDEFAIFQTGYQMVPDEISDLDQRMVINVSHATMKRFQALGRMSSVSLLDPNIASCITDNLEMFSILHSDGHNLGHFVGNWPYEDTIKKNCIIYEAVEEFKACLASIIHAEYVLPDDTSKESYAVSVFMSRFFGYGLDAYVLTNHRRETVREITVGLLFFQWLLRYGAICLTGMDDRPRLKIRSEMVRHALREAYRRIDYQESLCNFDASDLQPIAKDWYEIAFPSGRYSKEAVLVYNNTRMEGGD